ncbi:hypothetical protein ACHAXA_011508 [Cyclostephanos tholiformis]|uniref:Leucine-rich repeat-containing protein DDB_G0290503 n=1 Tax=Cyclostephanos tholiformis TaxID=382380 RepID=A0ABD3SDI0_9STRA
MRWTSGTESQEESTSQRIDASPSSPEFNIVESRSTLLTDLSDLEHSLTDEASSVKNWLRKVKSERNKLRRDKKMLMQQLAHEKRMREGDVSRLRTEVAVTKAKGDHDRDQLWCEIRCLKEQLLEHDAIKERDATKAATDVANLKNQVDCAKAEIKSLEEALMMEKSLSTMREINKEEEMRKIHFTQMNETIMELETKFKIDFDEMSERKSALLEEERALHAITVDKLQAVKIEKEQATKDLNAKIQELDSLKAENEKHATVFNEKISVANEELKSLRAEIVLSRQAHDSAMSKVQTVTADMEALSLQLQVKNAELVNQIQEHDRTKNQMKKLSDLVEVMSTDRDKAREDLEDSQAQVQHLTKANAEAEDVLSQLKEEAEKHRVEIEALNEARKYFDVYEEESQAEIKKLKMRLDEFTGDILRSIQSIDSSQGSIESNKIGNDCRREDGSGKNILNSEILALPSLVDEVGTERNSLGEAKTDKLELAEKECAILRADITQFKRERDALRKMVDTLLPLADGNDIVQLESLEKEVVDLKAKLSKADEAYIKLESEKCEMLASITQERDELATQIGKLNAVLLSDQPVKEENDESAVSDSADYTVKEDKAGKPDILSFLKKKLETQVQQTNIVNEELWQLHCKLDAQVEENEKLSTELAALRTHLAKLQLPDEQVAEGNDHHLSENANDPQCETKFVERIRDVESLLDLQVKENEKLRSELTALTVSTGNDANAVMQMSKVMEELKQEHRIEIKLLKQEHAEIKTKAKLLEKEKDEMANAYEVEKLSNNELESSLEDIVNLFQAERALHDKKSKEYKIIKKKFSSMRKKRLPVDAAYQACRAMLDRLEGSTHEIFSSKAHEPQSESRQDATICFELIDILSCALDGPSGSKMSLASIYERFCFDENQAEELAFKVMCLQNKVEEMKLKVRMTQLTMLPAHSVDKVLSVGDASAQTTLSNEQYEDLDCLRNAYNSLQEKSSHLTKELVDSTKAFEETISSYEAVIAKVKGLLSEKKKENATLKSDLEKARSYIASQGDKTIASLEKINADSLEVHKEEVNAYREAVDVLKRRLEEEEVIKAKLNMDLDRLKSDFRDVVSQFEQEITLSCEANEKAIQKKRKERDDANAALSAKEKVCSRLAEDLDFAGKELSNFKQAIHSLHVELGKAKSDRQHLELMVNELQNKLASNYDKGLASLKADKEHVHAKNVELTAKVQELQNKLDGAILSNNECMQFYERLRVDFTSLKLDKKKDDKKNAELAANNATLTAENGALVEQIEKQTQSYDQIEIQLDRLRKEVQAAQKENAELAANNATLTAENGALVEQIEKQTQSYDQIEIQLDRLRKEVQAAQKENADLAANIATLTTENGTLMDQIEKQKQSHDQIEIQLDSVRKEVQAAQKENAELAANITALTAENGTLVDQIEKQKQSHDQIEIQLDSVRKEVHAAEKDKIKAAEKAANLEIRIKSLREEIRNDIALQQEEIQKLQSNHLDALKKVDSLSEVVSALKGTLAIEKENAQILLSQFQTSEDERKSCMKQKEILEVEVASRLQSESIMSERIRSLEGVETELASRIKSENSKAERIRHLEMDLQEVRLKLVDKERELNNLSAIMMENANMHNSELSRLKSKIDEDRRNQAAMEERISSMESHSASLQQEFKSALNKSEEEASKLRVILNEAKGKLKQLHDQNEMLKQDKNESLQSLQQMLNDAVRSRTNTDASLQESLQLIEQQKRIDIKRKGEISKLEQTVEILKSKERYLESYVASLKKQTRRG